MEENKTIRGLVSVVMPVYNIASCLGASISSILNQSYQQWELLLVNDGSTDDSGAVCDEFAGRDKRIKVFHVKNAGVSAARNIGLSNASGEYLMFCDSDDLISPDFMRVMIHQLINEQADMVRCFMKPIDETVREYIHGKEDLPWRLYDGRDRTGIPAPMYDVVWGKLYRRQIVIEYGIEFDRHLNRGEDTLFAYQTVLCSQRIVYSENQLVNYRVRSGSLMRSNPSVSLFKQSVLKYHNICGFIKQHNSFDVLLNRHIKLSALNCAAQELVMSATNQDLFISDFNTFCSDKLLRRDLWQAVSSLTKRVGIAVVIMLMLHSPKAVKQVRKLVYALTR